MIRLKSITIDLILAGALGAYCVMIFSFMGISPWWALFCLALIDIKTKKEDE